MSLANHPRSFSVVMTEEIDRELREHLDKGPVQEDLTFAYWRPSEGAFRDTALVDTVAHPMAGDRLLHGNAAFTSEYLIRVLAGVPEGHGIAFLHSHLGPGWQGLSGDDRVAERERLAKVAFARTGLPLVGLTLARDRVWSARSWQRLDDGTFDAIWAHAVRVVGAWMRLSLPGADTTEREEALEATVNVWGEDAQSRISNARIGIVGLGSVGSVAAEALARVGVRSLTLIDHDVIKNVNLDRTLGASRGDIGRFKVDVARDSAHRAATAANFSCQSVPVSVVTEAGSMAALDCDILLSCVDRPWPRYLLMTIAYGHLIPVVDGGILARVLPTGLPLHVDWRIHTLSPTRPCLYCLGALRRSDVALDMEGRLDDPDYVQGLPEHERSALERRNVFLFSLSVAAHQGIQMAGMLTGLPRIGGLKPQMYHSYPGVMETFDVACEPDCEIPGLVGSAPGLATRD